VTRKPKFGLGSFYTSIHGLFLLTMIAIMSAAAQIRKTAGGSIWLGALAAAAALMLWLFWVEDKTALQYKGSVPEGPWMDPRELSLITKNLVKDLVMLEYGSGGSTRKFAPMVKQYIR